MKVVGKVSTFATKTATKFFQEFTEQDEKNFHSISHNVSQSSSKHRICCCYFIYRKKDGKVKRSTFIC